VEPPLQVSGRCTSPLLCPLAAPDRSPYAAFDSFVQCGPTGKDARRILPEGNAVTEVLLPGLHQPVSRADSAGRIFGIEIRSLIAIKLGLVIRVLQLTNIPVRLGFLSLVSKLHRLPEPRKGPLGP